MALLYEDQASSSGATLPRPDGDQHPSFIEKNNTDASIAHLCDTAHKLEQ
jgi:hypothetical protein